MAFPSIHLPMYSCMPRNRHVMQGIRAFMLGCGSRNKAYDSAANLIGHDIDCHER